MKGRKVLILFLAAALAAAPVQTAAGSQDSSAAAESTVKLEDGVYTPDSFSWSGGTGRLKGISCTQITVTDGEASATVVFASNSYDMVRVDGKEYEGIISDDTSTFEIPVRLNANNAISGRTTKMSQPHWIDYSIYIGLGDGQKEPSDSDAPQIPGLSCTGSLDVEYAEYFRLYDYENGISVLEIDAGEDTLQYLLAPEGAELPAGIEKTMDVIQVPVEKAYVASESGLEILDEIDKLDRAAASGIDNGSGISFAGTYDAPDFKTLVKTGCTLAVMPSDILGDQAGEVEEQLSLLKIPMLIDRSADEKDESAREEWRQVFDALF